ncbi:cell wall-binding repeat-containing protein [Leifsonia poae]|uniref:cell wall-binding repeat-containing protein n=1 Tax=Leifsonia poae TaxID=110933 RepID=UPI003D67CA2C
MTLSGHVTLGDGATPAGAGGVRIDLYCFACGPVVIASTTTDAFGDYEFTQPTIGTATYVVDMVDTASDGFLNAWWTPDAGTTGSYARLRTQAEVIDLTAGGSFTADMIMPKPASISGRVITAAGQIPRVRVDVSAVRTDNFTNPWSWLYPESGYPVVDATTVPLASDGTYTIPGLMPGKYIITFAPNYFVGDSNLTGSYAGSTLQTPLAKSLLVARSGQAVAGADGVLFNGATDNVSVTCPGCGPTGYTMLTRSHQAPGGGWIVDFSSHVEANASNDVRTVIAGLLPGTYRLLAYRADDPQLGYGVTTVTVAEGEVTNTGLTIERPSTSRVSGADRFAVGAAVSNSTLAGSAGFASGVPVVYIANGLNFPDALSAGPAAAEGHGPVLLVTPSSIPPAVDTELRRLAPRRIVVVGGSASVSDSVVAALAGYVPDPHDVVRVSGADRYSASRAVAMAAFGRGGASTAYLATGANYPDALAAGAPAAEAKAPVILVNGNSPTADAETLATLKSLGVTTIKVVGGEASVSAGYFASLQRIPGTKVTRLGGSDRYAASVAVNSDAFPRVLNLSYLDYVGSTTAPPDYAFLALGTNYPDALSGVPRAAALGAPLFIVPGSCIPTAVLEELRDLQITHLVLLGGTGSLTTAVAAYVACPS